MIYKLYNFNTVTYNSLSLSHNTLRLQLSPPYIPSILQQRLLMLSSTYNCISIYILIQRWDWVYKHCLPGDKGGPSPTLYILSNVQGEPHHLLSDVSFAECCPDCHSVSLSIMCKPSCRVQKIFNVMCPSSFWVTSFSFSWYSTF